MYAIVRENKVKTKIVAIGNSQGIRIPKPLLEEAQLREGEEVDLRLTPEGLVIERVSSPRRGWSDAAAQLALSSAPEEDPFVPAEFDEEDWEW
jgi:antitoxin MazE